MKRTLTALTVAALLMASVASAFDTTDQIKLVLPSPVYTVEETEEEMLYDRKSMLFVEENGIQYVIELDDKELWYVTYFYKSIEAVVDLDGDGIGEVLLKTQSGGSCCGPTFHIIKRVDEGFYDILSHEELQGWPSVSINQSENRTSLLVRNASEGTDNTSMEDTIVELEVVDGKLRLISKSSNTAMIHAAMQVTSEELKTIGNKTLEYDLDLDGKPDRLECSYWDRWGAVSCSLNSSKYGEQMINGGCNRIGILPTTANKMHDLVCDRSDILSWDREKRQYAGQK
jgi:hypothetical protein